MSLKLALCLTTILFTATLADPRPLKKCCPLGNSLQYSDDKMQLICRNSTPAADDFSWLPQHNLSTVGNLKDIVDNHTILYEFPGCHKSSQDILFLDRNISTEDPVLEFEILVEDDERFVLTSLKHPARHDIDVAHPTRFITSDFCVDEGPDDRYIAFLCPCVAVSCSRKCCNDMSAFNRTTRQCSPVDDVAIQYWLPELESNDTVYYRLISTLPQCESGQLSIHTPTKKEDQKISRQLVLLKNGSLQTVDKKRVFDSYCADYTADHGEMVQFCQERDTTLDNWYRFYGVLFLIGSLGLALAIALTLALPELRQNLHQKMALAHNCMLIIANVTAGVGQWSTESSMTTCKWRSFIIQISLLATFFWLNSMCIDITHVFSGQKQTRTTPRQTTKKFVYFAVYSWGSTLLFTAAMAIVEFTPSITVLKPNFGTARCFFNNKGALWMFLYGPIAVILFINCLLFIYTSLKIMAVKKETAILSEDDSHTNAKNKQNYVIFTKLFLLMGISWITEIMGLLIGGPVWAWVFTDVINLLEGVFIFVIFCCTRTVYNLLVTKCRLLGVRCGVDAASAVDDDSKSTTTKSSNMEMDVMPNKSAGASHGK